MGIPLEENMKKRLEKEKKEVELEIKDLGKSPEFGEENKQEEETDESEEYGTRLGLQRAAKEKLTNINSALQKIRRGNYGICEQCAKKISVRLLKIESLSRLCQNCKKFLKKKMNHKNAVLTKNGKIK